jgi:7-carboxy-7-deazaguanine synthase
LMAEYDFQLKFVVDQPDDVAEIEQLLLELPELSADRVLLMPQGRSGEELAAHETWLPALCEDRGWTYCPRRQIEWFGPVRGT